MDDAKKLSYLSQAVDDGSLSDLAFRVIAKALLTPKPITPQDREWARSVLKQICRGELINDVNK